MIKKVDLRKFITGVIFVCILVLSQNVVFGAQSLTLNYDNKSVKYSGVSYKITIDNNQVKTDLPGIVFNKATMFPLRPVFETLGGTVIWNSKTQIMDITYRGNQYQFQNNSSSVKINGKTVKLSSAAKKINDRLVVPVDFLKNINGLTYDIDNKAAVIKITTNFIGSVKEITTANSGEKTVVTLRMNDHKGYKYYRLTNPNRIVVEFNNVKTTPKDIKTESQQINGISVAALSENSAGVTINLKEMANFTVTDIGDGCKITIEKPVIVNLSYVNKYDRVYLALKDIKLTEIRDKNGYKYIAEKYKHEFDKDKLKYIITIDAAEPISFQDKVYHIDDSRISTVEIFRDKETLDTKIVINAKQEFAFLTSYNEKSKQTEINLLTPAKEGEVLVVIDPGHGGQDPGANNGNVLEKDLNLAIALKLEELLKKSNIKTFMLRQDDTFVELYDRPFIANALNATLFVSIHHNAIDSKKISGTETLYYPAEKDDPSFNGEKFAKLVQDALISKLKSVDRKTVPRPGLVVLKYTKMPAILAEIGFVTNPAELKNLTNPEYQQKAADALGEATMKALEIIEAERKAKADLENRTKENNADNTANADNNANSETESIKPDTNTDQNKRSSEQQEDTEGFI